MSEPSRPIIDTTYSGPSPNRRTSPMSTGAIMSAILVAIPFLGVLGVALGIAALIRRDPDTTPERVTSAAAIVVGAVTTTIWAVIFYIFLTSN